jgi:tetratricopeptide (TPR) repeat protein
MRHRIALFMLTAIAALHMNSASAQQFTRGNALVNESAYAVDMERWSEGVKLAEDALRSGEVTLDNMPALYNNMCIGLTGMRRFNDAIAACDKALELKPRQWSFYNNRANIYFYLGQFSKALAEYYKAVTFNPANSILINNIGLTLEYRKSRAEKTS